MDGTARFVQWTLISAALAIVVGCSSRAGRPAPAGRPVSLTEFASEIPAPPLDASDAGESGPEEPPSEVIEAIEEEPAPYPLAATDLEGMEDLDLLGMTAGTSLLPGEPLIIERMVGQVNGRPVYADEFFEPIADELWAEGQRLSEREFMNLAADLVGNRLREVVLSELFLAEAESQLTMQQQMGLLAWLDDVREGLFAEKGSGSGAQANQRLLETEGVTTEAYLQQYRDEALVSQLLRDKISPRVIVSWRDVQREYERRFDEFNPQGSVSIDRIRLNTKRDEQRVVEVQQRLDGGESFPDVARAFGMPDDGRLGTFELGAGGLAEVGLSEAFRQQLAGLHEGDTTTPFQVGSSTNWLHVAEISQPPGRSIYDPDVQRSLMASLRNRRFAEEQNRYVKSLFEQGIYGELEIMNERLLEMAIIRFGPR